MPKMSPISGLSQNGDSVRESRDDFNDTFEKDILPSVSLALFGGKQATKSQPGCVDIQDSFDWLKIVVEKNVPDGKQKRGRVVEFAYNQLVPDATEEQQNLARILGWCVEILQASSLIADDIMDSGLTRRGRPCWYLQNNMGPIAFNDTLLLEQLTYQLLHKYFSHLPMYTELVDVVHRVIFQTTLGQSLDTRQCKSRNYEQFSESMYYAIVEYKTGYYTCYLPVALARILAGISEKEPKYQNLCEKVEKASLQLGILFQVQDDFLDCFHSEEKLGKKESDVEEGKCTWLLITALKLATPNQRTTLIDNYGHQDPDKIAEVKKLYNSLDLKTEYKKFREKYVASIVDQINGIEHEAIRNVLNSVVHVMRAI